MTVAVWVIDPLVAGIVIEYVPKGVLRDVLTVRVDVENGPTVAGREVVGPCFTIGETIAVRLTVPLKPFVPCTVTVKVVEDPRDRDREDGVTVKMKSGAEGAVKIAVCTFSGTGVGPPAMVTHVVVPETLLLLHPF